MSSADIPMKTVTINEFPVRDKIARRLFILIDGKKTLADICRVFRTDWESSKTLFSQMEQNGYITFLEQAADDTPANSQSATPDSAVSSAQQEPTNGMLYRGVPY